MRYSEIRTLLEYDRSKTIAAVSSAILSRVPGDMYLKGIVADKEENEIVDTVVSHAEEVDPSPNKQYVIWILRQFTKNRLKFEDMYKLRDDLELFFNTRAQHKRMGINSDINKYDCRTLSDTTAKLQSTELAEPEQDQFSPVENTKVLYNGPLGLLAIPETEEASCELGSRTKWCTAATKSQNRFHQYNDQGPLYIWIDKKTKKKFQFHFETYQFMDELDYPIQPNLLRHFAFEHPLIKKLFASKKDILEKTFDDYVWYMDDKREYEEDPDEYVDNYGSPHEENVFLDEIDPTTVFVLADKDTVEKSMKHIKKNPALSFAYAKGIIKGAWPAGERSIASDLWYAVDYAKEILQARWPAVEDKIARAAQSDNYYRADVYAKNVIKGRWSEAEKFGKYNPSFIVAYSEEILNGRWPEAEQYLFNRSDYYGKYTVNSYLKLHGIDIDDLNMSAQTKEILKNKINIV